MNLMNNLLPENKQGSQERMILMTRTSIQEGYYFEENGIWYLRYWERDHFSGKWKHPKKRLGKFKAEKAARLFGEPIMAEVNFRNNTAPEKLFSDMTFQTFIDGQWQSYQKKNKHSPSSVYTRRVLLDNHILPAFGQKKLREIEPIQISEFLDGLEGYAENTQSNIYGILHLIFELALELSLIGQSPVRPKVHRPQVTQKEKPTLTAAQIRSLIDAMETEQEKLLILLLSYTAVRINEALALRWSDFEAEANLLFVRHTLYKGKVKPAKTEASKAKILLPPTLSGALATHRQNSRFYRESDFIFSRSNGLHLSYSASLKHLKKALKKIGVVLERSQYGFHILRHSAGTLAYELTGGNLKLVQKGMRHANSQTTSDVYIHLSDEAQGEFGRVLEAKIAANCTLSVPDKKKKIG